MQMISRKVGMRVWEHRLRRTAFVFVLATLCAGVLHAKTMYQTFEGFSDGEALPKYTFATDTTLGADNPYAIGSRVTEDSGNKAIYVNLDDGNLDPTGQEVVDMETSDLQDTGASANYMEAHLAITVPQAVQDENTGNPSLVDQAYYYVYTDTDDDGIGDTYYDCLVASYDDGGPLDTAGTLQSYGKKYLKDEGAPDGEADQWDEWDDTGAWVATHTGVPEADNVTRLGVSMWFNNFDDGGETDYATVWADNVFLIPEPNSFALLAGLSILATAARRRSPRRK